MKALLTVSIFFLSAFAMADQTIHCTGNGTALKVFFGFNQNGTLSKTRTEVKMKGFWEEGAVYGQEFEFISYNQSKKNAENQYTTIFFNDVANGGLVEYQLQFEEAVVKRNFRQIDATLVVGFENNSSEPYPSFGHKLSCSGRVK